MYNGDKEHWYFSKTRKHYEIMEVDEYGHRWKRKY